MRILSRRALIVALLLGSLVGPASVLPVAAIAGETGPEAEVAATADEFQEDSPIPETTEPGPMGTVPPPTAYPGAAEGAVRVDAGEDASDGPAEDDEDGFEEPPPDPALAILGRRVEPGTRARLIWRNGATFVGEPMEAPVIVVHGQQPGPVLCLTGAVHGDELNGVEAIRRVLAAVDPRELAGTVIGVPIVNMAGFSRGSRYLPDRRDLNRFFPGNPNGSSASRIAHDFFGNVIRHCTALVDFHTGSFDRANLPQVRGDMRLDSVVELTRGFGATAVLHTPGSPGMLRRAATDAGIPAVTFELGAPVRLEPAEIDHGVTAIETLMNRMGMTQRVRMWREPQPVFYESRWVRAARAGMLFADVRLGDRVRQGQRLGRVINPLNDEQFELVSPVRGRVLGMALNQVVLPGYAAFHIGEEASEAQLVRDAATIRENDESERMDEGEEAMDPALEGSTEQVEESMPERERSMPE